MKVQKKKKSCVTVFIIIMNGTCSFAINNYQTVLDYFWSPILLCNKKNGLKVPKI